MSTKTTLRPSRPAPAKLAAEPEAAAPALHGPLSASSGPLELSTGAAPRPHRTIPELIVHLEKSVDENRTLAARLTEKLTPVSLPPGGLGEQANAATHPSSSEMAVRLEAQVAQVLQTNRLIEDAIRRLQL